MTSPGSDARLALDEIKRLILYCEKCCHYSYKACLFSASVLGWFNRLLIFHRCSIGLRPGLFDAMAVCEHCIVVVEVGSCQSCCMESSVVLHKYCASNCIQIWQNLG